MKLPPEIPLRSEVKDPDIPLIIITTVSGIQRQNTLVLQDTKGIKKSIRVPPCPGYSGRTWRYMIGDTAVEYAGATRHKG